MSELLLVDGKNHLDRLQLNNDFPFKNQIGAKSFFERLSLVENGDGDLTLQETPAFFQLACQRHFIDGFQQSGAKVLMSLNRAVD